jgi:hypothetical protein
MEKSFIERRECGGKVNIVGGDNIGHCEKRNFIWRAVKLYGGIKEGS